MPDLGNDPWGFSTENEENIGDSRSSIFRAFCMVNELTVTRAEMYQQQIGILFGIISSINRVSGHRKGVIGSICSSSLSGCENSMLYALPYQYIETDGHRRPAANICRVFIYARKVSSCQKGIAIFKTD